MMSSISPSEEQTSSKAKKSWKYLYDERMASLQTEGLSSSYDHPEIAQPDVDFTPCPRDDKSRKAWSNSPTRPMSDRITVGVSSTFDRLMMSMGTQKGGASSSTRRQPQLNLYSLGLTPVSGAASETGDMFAGVMTGIEELRRDMTKRIDRVEERAHQGQEKLRDELTNVRSQARVDKAQLIRNTDQCLAENLVQATKESEERKVRMTREIERLLIDHDNTYAHTMTSLEKRLDAKSDLMMRKLDEILNGVIGRSVPPQGSAHARQMMEHAAMPGPSKVRERITNISTGSRPGQPHRGQVGQTRSRRHDCPLCHPGDTIAHCATSQISARSDYSLAGHNDVCFDV